MATTSSPIPSSRILSLAAYLGYPTASLSIMEGSIFAIVEGIWMLSGRLVGLYRLSNAAALDTETGEIVIAIEAERVSEPYLFWMKSVLS